MDLSERKALRKKHGGREAARRLIWPWIVHFKRKHGAWTGRKHRQNKLDRIETEEMPTVIRLEVADLSRPRTGSEPDNEE